MADVAQNDSFYENDPRTLQFTVTDADSGGALNLTGKSITWKMIQLNRYNIPTDTAVLTKTTASGVTVTNSTGGILTVTINSSDTSTLLGTKSKKIYYHQLEINDVITTTGRLTIFKAV